MIRVVVVLALASLVGLAALVYKIKYESTALSREIAQISRDIENERDTISALRAQYSALSKPSRLQGLAERHLKHLRPFAVSQLAVPGEVPERLPDLANFLDKLPLGAGLPVVDSEVGSPTGSARKPILPPTPRNKGQRVSP